jgi:hypothetical protein
VARVATLEQAAGVGGMAVRDLVATLRRAAGVEEDAASGASAAPAGPESPPDWLVPARVVATLDADALLDAGQVPLPLVNEKARALGPGELLRVDSGFRPVPLVEAFARQGFRAFVRETAAGRFETFVTGADDSGL